MDITVKVKRGTGKPPAAVVRARLQEAAPEIGSCKVEEVFPDVDTGRRAGLVVVKLPENLSNEQSKAVLRSLRSDSEIEYAEPAAPRKAR